MEELSFIELDAVIDGFEAALATLYRLGSDRDVSASEFVNTFDFLADGLMRATFELHNAAAAR